MLCASEILLRIYAIINCIKQISILLDTEAEFGFHLAPFDTVSLCGYRTVAPPIRRSRISRAASANYEY